MEIVLGQRYRDQVTGFEGIAIAKYEYLFACERVTLQADVKDGDVKEFTTDVPALEKAVGRTYIPQTSSPARTGGDRPGGERSSHVVDPGRLMPPARP